MTQPSRSTMRWLTRLAPALLLALFSAGCCLGPEGVIEAPPRNAAPPPPPQQQYEPPAPPPYAGPQQPQPPYSPQPGYGGSGGYGGDDRDRQCTFEAGVRQGQADGSRRSEVSWGAASCAANAVFPMLCFGVEIANEHTPVYVPSHEVCSPGYEDGYRHGYSHAVHDKRTDAMLWGGIAGAAIWGIALVLVLTTDAGHHTHSDTFNDATAGPRAPPGIPLGRF